MRVSNEEWWQLGEGGKKKSWLLCPNIMAVTQSFEREHVWAKSSPPYRPHSRLRLRRRPQDVRIAGMQGKTSPSDA